MSLNLNVVPAQAAYLKETGVNWTFVGGTTGESVKMTISERKKLVEAWMATDRNVISHVGAGNVEDSRDLAMHAVSVGAKAIGVMPPSFFKPATAKSLAATVGAICSAAPSLPCYYYHIPSMNSVDIDMYQFVLAIEELTSVSNFCGIKYTGMYTYPGMAAAQKIMAHEGGKYEVLSGREEMMVQALSIGIKGFVGSQFNLAGDLYGEILTRFAQEGLTPSSLTAINALQQRALKLLDAWRVTGPDYNGFKYFGELAGLPLGDARLPNLPISADRATKEALAASFTSFCASTDGKGLRICEKQTVRA
jgi:N-acetylneuraminate lyase